MPLCNKLYGRCPITRETSCGSVSVLGRISADRYEVCSVISENICLFVCLSMLYCSGKQVTVDDTATDRRYEPERAGFGHK